MMNFIKKRYFILLFLSLVLLAYMLIIGYQENSTAKHLNNKTESIYLEYRVIYDKHKALADLIFMTEINTPKIVNLFKEKQRNELHEFLLSNYTTLRKFNVRQLQFHLPNNDSFLRMHRPSKFGDNLSKDRLTVKYVNENLMPVDGFEEGKVYNAFRFVYPLFKDTQHIGSVEISFTALAFIKDIVKHYNVLSNFHIDKKIVDLKVFKDEKNNYVQSPIHGYYCQKSIIEYIGIDLNKRQKSMEESEELYVKIHKGLPFSNYIQASNEIITYIPVINPITKHTAALFTFRSKDLSIAQERTYAQLTFFISIIIIAAILLLLYKEMLYKEKLTGEVKSRTLQLEIEKSKLNYKANHDALTSLYNRLSLNLDIETVIKQHNIHKAPYAILMFDIDWFKSVNDEHGHDVGDYVLVEIATLMQKSVREEDKVYRAGGEEFVLLLQRISLEDAMNLAQKIRKVIQNHIFKIKEIEFSKTVSAGLYHSSFIKVINAKTVLKLVDTALYESKTNGRNRVTNVTQQTHDKEEEQTIFQIKLTFSDTSLSNIIDIEVLNDVDNNCEIEELLNHKKSFRDCLYKEDLRLLENIPKNISVENPYTTTVRILDANKAVILYRINVYNENSRTIIVLQKSTNIFQSVSDKTLIQNFQAMLENSNDYIYFKDKNHVFTAASQTLVSITSVAKRADLIGKIDYEVFDKELADKYFQLERKVLDEEIEVAQELQPTVDKNGNKTWVDNRKYPIRDEKGDIIGLFGIARIISSDDKVI